MNYKELLFNKDKVLSFYPELAVILNKYDKILAEEEYKSGDGTGKKRKAGTLGLNEAIIINQISYWNEINKKTNNNFKDGYYWTYNTYEKWAKNDFPYWSADTIRKSITALEDMGIIISTDKYNSYKIDNTKWYRVDYDKLQKIIDVVEQKEKESYSEIEKEVSQAENESCGYVNVTYTDGLGNLNMPIPDTTTDITNKDYNTDTKGKNINKVNEQVKTSFSEKKLTHTQKSAKQRYLDKKADEFEMLNNILLICNSDYDEQIGNEIFKSLEHYFERYTQKTGLIHPILKTETLEEIIDKMANYSDMEYFHFGNIAEQEGAFIKIIDAFFDGDFGSVTGQRTNWHLPHFMSDGVLDRLTQRLWEAGEVY